jgi:hypothetical protein
MGIKYLNRFLIEKCKRSSIGKKTLNIMRDKTIVIDTSIYMYKYTAQGSLLENFYLMISTFRKYNITPLFVFDGKPPAEKKELLKERQNLKTQAEAKYKELVEELAKADSSDQKKELSIEMECLKKQFVRIREKDIISVKNLLNAYGVMYYEASGESDRVCAHLVIIGKAWACLSDDMDMFVYGCPRVLRHMSLLNNSVLLYKFDNILNDLKMDMNMFRQIGVLSGTDYNIHQNTCLTETIRWYNEFNRKDDIDQTNDLIFYNWLNKNTKYIGDMKQLIHTHNMFCFERDMFRELDDLTITMETKFDVERVKEIIQQDGFVFLS